MYTRKTRYYNLNLFCFRYGYTTEGGCSFKVRFIRDWNSLPRSLRVLNSYSHFKTKLFKKFYSHFEKGVLNFDDIVYIFNSLSFLMSFCLGFVELV